LKVDLENLSGALYLIPKKDLIVSDEDKVEVSKQELCQGISKHYIKILYLLTLIKSVYDLENNGDHSLAGIMRRNLVVIDNVMEINYCSIPHKDYELQHADKISFHSLEGFQFFVEHFLTPVERIAFIDQFRAILARKPRHKVINAICTDALVPLSVYQKLYAQKVKKKIQCATEETPTVKRKRERNIELLFEVAPDNPIFNTDYCLSSKKLVIPLSNKEPGTRKLNSLRFQMQKNYDDNIKAVEGILNKIVEFKGSKWELRNVSNKEIQAIIKEVKQTIIVFYIQSLVDYHLLLDCAKEIPSVRIDNKK
jgi:hypothetical protein